MTAMGNNNHTICSGNQAANDTRRAMWIEKKHIIGTTYVCMMYEWINEDTCAMCAGTVNVMLYMLVLWVYP